VLGFGVASAAPGDGDEVAGCYHKNSGALRVVDSGERCGKNEVPISWSKDAGSPTLADGSVQGGPGGVVLDGSLTGHDLGEDSVGGSELANAAVDTANLVTGAVRGGPGGVVLDESLTRDDLGEDSVGGSELGDAAVATANLVAGAVRGGPGGVVEDGSLTRDDLAASSVGRDQLAAGSVGSGQIEDGSVRRDDIADGAVNGAKIDNGSVGTSDLGAGAVTTDKLTAGVASATSGPDVLDGTDGPTGVVVNSVTTDLGPNHKLLLLAQNQLRCNACTGLGDLVPVTWRLYEGNTPVSEEYETVLTATSPAAVASVQALLPDTGAPGPHTYDLRMRADTTATTVAVTGDSLTALDIGR
jgi:hypothetical protein